MNEDNMDLSYIEDNKGVDIENIFDISNMERDNININNVYQSDNIDLKTTYNLDDFCEISWEFDNNLELSANCLSSIFHIQNNLNDISDKKNQINQLLSFKNDIKTFSEINLSPKNGLDKNKQSFNFKQSNILLNSLNIDQHGQDFQDNNLSQKSFCRNLIGLDNLYLDNNTSIDQYQPILESFNKLEREINKNSFSKRQPNQIEERNHNFNKIKNIDFSSQVGELNEDNFTRNNILRINNIIDSSFNSQNDSQKYENYSENFFKQVQKIQKINSIFKEELKRLRNYNKKPTVNSKEKKRNSKIFNEDIGKKTFNDFKEFLQNYIDVSKETQKQLKRIVDIEDFCLKLFYETVSEEIEGSEKKNTQKSFPIRLLIRERYENNIYKFIDLFLNETLSEDTNGNKKIFENSLKSASMKLLQIDYINYPKKNKRYRQINFTYYRFLYEFNLIFEIQIKKLKFFSSINNLLEPFFSILDIYNLFSEEYCSNNSNDFLKCLSKICIIYNDNKQFNQLEFELENFIYLLGYELTKNISNIEILRRILTKLEESQCLKINKIFSMKIFENEEISHNLFSCETIPVLDNGYYFENRNILNPLNDRNCFEDIYEFKEETPFYSPKILFTFYNEKSNFVNKINFDSKETINLKILNNDQKMFNVEYKLISIVSDISYCLIDHKLNSKRNNKEKFVESIKKNNPTYESIVYIYKKTFE